MTKSLEIRKNSFGSGLVFLFKGFSTLKEHPSLKKYIILPLAIDLLVFFFGLFMLGGFVMEQVAKMSVWLMGVLSFAEGIDWLFGVIYYPLMLVAIIAFGIFWIYITFILGTVVAAPFNALLAEKTLLALGAVKEQKFKMLSWMKFTIKMLFASVVKAIVFTFFALILFVCSLIPGLNVVSAFGALLIVSFDCLDYSYEVLEMGFGKRFSHFIKFLPTAGGMATSLGATLIIPGSTLLLLPVAVVGASRLLTESNGDSNELP
ncbi:MAG: EI24 domain-containing protein [Bdellovibrionales bacterium]